MDDQTLVKFCAGCDRELEVCDWDGDSDYCDRCLLWQTQQQWIDDTERWLHAIASERGWTCKPCGRSQVSQSRYYIVSRADDELKIRISEHSYGSSLGCFCDYSLVFPPGSGTADSTLDHVRNRLC